MSKPQPSPPPSKAQQISDRIKEIAGTDLAHLERNLEPVSQMYGQYKVQVESVINLARTLENLSWGKIPVGIQEEAHNLANQLHGMLRQLRDFKLDPNKPATEQGQSLFRNFAQQQNLDNRFPLPTYSTRLSSLVGLVLLAEGTPAELASAAEGLKNKIDEIENYIGSKKSEIDTIVSAAAEAAAKTGAERHAGEFDTLAKEHHDAARNWLIATVVMTVVAITASILIFDVWGMLRGSEQALAFTQIMPRVIVVSLMYSLALWSSRNYKSHRHLHVVSKHRQTSLQTFRAFVAAAEDDATVKNAILLECTKTIFGHSATGYLDSDPPPLSSTVVDVVRAVTKTEPTKNS